MRQVPGFHIGDVLRLTFVVYGRNLPAFAVLTALTSMPVFVLLAVDPTIMQPPTMPPPPEDPADVAARRAYVADAIAQIKEMTVSMGWYLVVSTFCSAWMSAGLSYAVVRTLRATRPGMRQSLWQSLRCLPCALAASVLVVPCIAVGFILLIVPGILLILMLWVVVPAAVVERRYGSALRRSIALTKGYKGRILGLVLLAGLVSLVGTMLSTTIASDFAPQFSPFVEEAWSTIMVSVFAVNAAVCYHHLRVLKEGMGASIAKVFE